MLRFRALLFCQASLTTCSQSPNTAPSMLLQKSLSWLMSPHNSCTQLIPSSYRQLTVVQRYAAPQLWVQVSEVCTWLNPAPERPQRVQETIFRVCFCLWAKQQICFPLVLPVRCLPTRAAQPGWQHTSCPVWGQATIAASYPICQHRHCSCICFGQDAWVSLMALLVDVFP